MTSSGLQQEVTGYSNLSWQHISFNFFSHLFIFERQRETGHEWGRVRESGRHRIWSRLQAPSCQQRARHGAQIYEPHDLSQSWTLNWATRALHHSSFLKLHIILRDWGVHSFYQGDTIFFFFPKSRAWWIKGTHSSISKLWVLPNTYKVAPRLSILRVVSNYPQESRDY